MERIKSKLIPTLAVATMLIGGAGCATAEQGKSLADLAALEQERRDSISDEKIIVLESVPSSKPAQNETTIEDIKAKAEAESNEKVSVNVIAKKAGAAERLIQIMKESDLFKPICMIPEGCRSKDKPVLIDDLETVNQKQ